MPRLTTGLTPSSPMSRTTGASTVARAVAWGAAATATLLAARAAGGAAAPVGHWRSPAGRTTYLAAYDRAMRRSPTPAETHDVPTDFGRVRMHRHRGIGDRDAPLVLIPGRGASSPIWSPVLPILRPLGDVVTLDLLGEPGRSIQEAPIRDADDQAAWLDRAIEALPDPSVHLVGVSMGGWTATNLAARRPGRIATLTLVDPVNTLSPIPTPTILRSLPASHRRLPRSWRDSFEARLSGGSPVSDADVAEMKEAGAQHYRSALPRQIPHDADTLAALSMPVLTILAGRSVVHDLETSRATLSAARAEAGIRVHPGASHALLEERPHAVAADISAFLEDAGTT